MLDPLGNSTEPYYNAQHQLVETEDCSGNRTAFRYNEWGQLTGITDAEGHHTTYRYDERHQPVQVTYADGSTAHFHYDFAGRLTTYTDRKGNSTHYRYSLDDLPIERIIVWICNLNCSEKWKIAMTEINTFRTLSAPIEAEFKDKGSRFIAYAFPIFSLEQIKEKVECLREEHHKARHWCYAYRLGTDGQQFRANDDGEPAGSAGRPILGQIDSFELTDVLVVVVRYFGGTLLGVPGLIHAYKTSTQLALKEAENQGKIIEKNIEKILYLQCEYADLNEALRIAKQYAAQVLEQDLQLDCRLTVSVALAEYVAAKAAWEKTRCIQISEPS